MKRIMSCHLISFMLLSLQVFGQDSTHNSLVPGAFALQFQSNGFYLQPFQSGGFSCKYQTSSLSAFRFGVGVNARSNLSQTVVGYIYSSGDYISIDIDLQYQRYLKTAEDISLYAGAGPYYSCDFYERGNTLYDSDYWSVGFKGFVGMEWFFKKSMSLSGEYGISAGYHFSRYVDSDGMNSRTGDGLSIGTTGQFKVGLSVYL